MECNKQTSIQLAFLANVIASVIAQKLTPTEENVLGNLLTLIGTALTTIAAIDESEVSKIVDGNGKTGKGISDTANSDR